MPMTNHSIRKFLIIFLAILVLMAIAYGEDKGPEEGIFIEN